jgi:hypothetical protein
MKIHTTLMRGLALVLLLLFDSAKALEEPISLAAVTMTSSVKNHRDLANKNDGSLPFDQWLQKLNQAQALAGDEDGLKDKVRELILLAQESTMDDEPINYESLDMNYLKSLQEEIKTLLRKAESQSMSPEQILEATTNILEMAETRQSGLSGIIYFILFVYLLGALLAGIIAVPVSLILAIPVAILALLSRVISRARYCIYFEQTCDGGGWRLLLIPLCLGWRWIDHGVCDESAELESEYTEFLLDTIPLLINAV